MKTSFEHGLNITDIIKSFLSSSLLVSALIIGIKESDEFIEITTLLLAFIGVLIFFDVLLAFNRPTALITNIFFFIGGIIVSLYSNIVGQLNNYFAIVILVVLLIYTWKYIKRYLL